ncbi:serrate RNA effector molecule homolog isoform X2 [Antedon mediterranea]|uniref:serrate RNA effector molecule homolog isoform X2 n=1 Tax=Antedon mediterranea TaxID=105859 RepID=UPI003AF9A933
MDSDDEDRRHNRDKFRRERSDYAERRDRDDRRVGREDWNDRPRDNRVNRDWQPRRDYNRNRRDRGYSPNRRAMSPPNKRPRRDWNTGGYRSYSNYGGGNYGGGGGGGNYWDRNEGGQNFGHNQSHRNDSGSSMMTFKQFLASQDDTIDDQEAVRKYNDYKVDFRRTQLSEYFLDHKDQEWFRTKYHPDLCMQQNAARLNGVRLRLNVFLELWKENWLDGISCEFNKPDEIIKVLDAAVIKMEGGTDLDLTILDEKEEGSEVEDEVEQNREKKPASEPTKEDEEKKEKNTEENNGKEDGEMVDDSDDKDDEKDNEEEKEKETKDEKVEEIKEKTEPKPDKTDEAEKRGTKRKRDREYSSSSSSSGGSSSDSDSDSDGEHRNKKDNKPEVKTEDVKGEKDEEAGEIMDEKPDPKDEQIVKKKDEKIKEEDTGPKPRPLHKTYSLFMRSLSVMIAKTEIVQICKKYPGFIRVALADPQPDKNFMRYGWATFDRSVNIKDICWNLSSIRVRDCELSPVVNRDLTRRIRATSAITAHKQVVRNDLKMAAKLINMLDEKYDLYKEPPAEPEKDVEEVKEEEPEKKESEEKKDGDDEKDENKEKVEDKPAPVEKLPFVPFHGYKDNPFLDNITEYLVEESSAEEEMLIAMGGGTEEDDEGEHKDEAPGYTFERDHALNKVLDRLLFYLRIVHSVDYYNASEYPIEDEMPNRCGIMHARGANPPKGLTEKDVTEWQTSFEKKIAPILQTKAAVGDTEWSKLGKKNPEDEVEKFVQANTQELSKDKWLCPLSGKKFKGPEFVRKHIFNKHNEKVDEVRKDVEYFNNYLKDTKRPQPPEPTVAAKSAQPTTPGATGHGNTQAGGFQSHQGQNHGGGGGGGYRQEWGNQNQGYDRGHHDNRGYGGGGGGFYNRSQGYGNNRPRRDPRPLIQYRDLDAPGDDDIF